MASRQFEEKQIVEKDLPKESLKDKESLKSEKYEKQEKQEKQEKVEKEHKEQKDVHDIKQYPKEKPEKEHKDKEKEKEKEHKLEAKENLLEKVPKTEGHEVYPQAQLAATSAGVGAQKFPEKYSAFDKFQKEIKAEIKEFKHEKLEIKEFKHEKFEKFEYEGVVGFGPPGGPVEQRVAALEATVTQLLHFIPENLRPDLSQGALKQEPDAAKQGPAGTAKAPEAKEPQGRVKS